MLDHRLLQRAAYRQPALPGLQAVFVLLQHLIIALLGSLMGGVLIGERLPTLVQQLSLGAQAIDILSRQVSAVSQAFQRFFESAQQLIAGVLDFGPASQALLACLLLCLMILQCFAATQYGLLETLFLFSGGRVIQLPPFPLKMAKAPAIEWFPGAWACFSICARRCSR